jgi:ABC-type phosphate/phosphonate transport system substrate-binding protein
MGVTGQASLPMYPMPELRPHWETLWAAVHERVPGSRPSLEWSADVHALWTDDDLALSQACGWPLVTELAGQATAIGTFDPVLPVAGPQRPGWYRSVIITRPSEGLRGPAGPVDLTTLAGATAAVNATDSLSGWISLIVAVLGRVAPWPGRMVTTGTHLASIEAVQSGLADIASIDAVSYALVGDLHPDLLDGLAVAGHGPLVPCLPLVVPCATSPAEIARWRDAFITACDDPATARARHHLHIRRFVPLDDGDYAVLATFD